MATVALDLPPRGGETGETVARASRCRCSGRVPEGLHHHLAQVEAIENDHFILHQIESGFLHFNIFYFSDNRFYSKKTIN